MLNYTVEIININSLNKISFNIKNHIISAIILYELQRN